MFIDHGAAVVVGEPAEIGDDVLLYHGVTLGGDSMRRGKRHLSRDGVPVGSNATLLEDVIVGDGASVGAGSVVVDRSRPIRPSSGRPNPSMEPGPIGSSRASAARSESGPRPERVQRRWVAGGFRGWVGSVDTARRTTTDKATPDAELSMNPPVVALLALLTGFIAGAAFAFVGVPIPAPPELAGLLGIVGIYLGFKTVQFLDLGIELLGSLG